MAIYQGTHPPMALPASAGLAGALPRPRLGILRIVYLALAGGGLLAYAAYTQFDLSWIPGADQLADQVGIGLYVLAAAACVVRAWVRRSEAAAWLLIGGGIASFGVAELLWVLGAEEPVTILGGLDILWGALYVVLGPALILLVRARTGRRASAFAWLDGIIAGWATACVGAAILIPFIVHADSAVRGWGLIAYPIVELVLLGSVVVMVGLHGWRPSATNLLFMAGLALNAVVDTVYAHEVGHNTYVEYTLLDVGWPAAMVLFGAAAMFGLRSRAARQPVRYGSVVVPALGAAAAIVVFALPGAANPVAAVLAIGTLVTAVVRLCVSVYVADRATAELGYRALHDSLTGLGNRTLLGNRLREALAESWQIQRRVGLLFIDLDDFKTINDSLGHAAGDRVLEGVATRLTGAVRDADLVVRLGGDEFAVLSKDASPEILDEVAERVHAVLRGPFPLAPGEPIVVSASVGVALSEPDSLPSTLLREADAAMYAAKAEGRGRTERFDPAMFDAAVNRLYGHRELAQALENDDLTVVYQPCVEFDTGRLAGFEALVRWRHSDGLLRPEGFIPLAEETGLIVPIGRWVLEAACRQAVVWEQAHHRPVNMAVNVSAVQFRRPGFAQEVAETLMATGLSAEHLVLELTEGAVFADSVLALDQLLALRRLGVRIALDDFGTGYSSLSHLRDFPVDILKIDKSFVGRLGRNPDANALVRSVILLAQALGLVVVAEGVETDAQAAYLAAEGCDLAQGYYFAAPLVPVAAEAFLLRHGVGTATATPAV